MNNMLLKVTNWQHYKFLFTHLRKKKTTKKWIVPHEITSVYFNLILNIDNRNKHIIEINVRFSPTEAVSGLHLWRYFSNRFFDACPFGYMCFSGTDQIWPSELEMNLSQFLIRWKDFSSVKPHFFHF